ncbi:MAG TPA: NlpC/P60 family protein [Rectinemataceae bacterium]|nr:NlpC/P60 family protein [Rectinemataceae bacterium]
MNYAEYVGIPFVDAGRTKEGCDCWGLVRIVLQEKFGKTLPAFDDYEKSTRDESERQVSMGLKALDVVRVDTPEEGDIALMRIRGKLCHTGLYIGNGEILHTNRGTCAVIEALDGLRHLRDKIEGFYRVS